jgi:4-diphosphocytidyl-2-C-methyl-D-erythritol kinase
MTQEIAAQAPAKVNLFLRVFGVMADGYHAVETLLARTSLADDLHAERRDSRGVTLSVEGIDTGPTEENLAVRGAQLVLEATGHRFGVHLTLTKRIPVQAGLGGGSSDGAQALLLVNQLAGNAIPRHELLQLAAKLGSDVPFQMSGARLAVGWHRGERLLRLPPLPPAPGLILVPPSGVGTADAYRWLDAARTGPVRRGAVLLDLDAVSTWGDVARMAGNDFEAPVFAERPAIRTAFDKLVGTGPMLCRLSGSGCAVFAVYRTVQDRDDAMMMLSPKLGQRFAVEVG